MGVSFKGRLAPSVGEQQARSSRDSKFPQLIVSIEDDPEHAELIQIHLEAQGFLVFNAPTAREGLLQFVCGRPDLVLLDVGLPDLDGWEVCRLIRGTSDVPIVFLTAFARPVDRERAFELGADGYVVKPFGASELLEVITACLDHTQEARALTESDGNFHTRFTGKAFAPHIFTPYSATQPNSR